MSAAVEVKYYVGDIGTRLIVSTGNNLTTATTWDLLVQKPSGAIDTWVGAIDGGDNTRIVYTIQNGDFDELGRYKLQAYVVFASGSWRGNTAYFTVSEAFK
jgi:hypothetical protein